MKITKKLLSAFLAVLMVLSVFPAGVIHLGAEDISLDVQGKDEINKTVGLGVNLLNENLELSKKNLGSRIFHTFNSAWPDSRKFAYGEFEYTYITDMSKWVENESASMSVGVSASATYKIVTVKAKTQVGVKGSFSYSGSESLEYAILSGKYYREVAKLDFYKDMRTVWEKNENGNYRYLTASFVDDLYTMDPAAFFSMYGTHVITSYMDGGEAYMVYQGEKLSDATSSMTEQNTSVSVGVEASGIAGISTDFESAGAVSQENANENSNITYTATLRGGVGSFSPDLIKNGKALESWGSSLTNPDQREIIIDENLGLFPIWDFIIDAEHYDRKVELEEYFNKHINAQNAEFYSDYVYSGNGQYDYADFTPISTPEELNSLLRAELDGNFVLLHDIDLSAFESWQPIGTKAEPFRGTLCGNGNTITGMKVTACADGLAGLFGSNDGIIRNLAVEGTVDVDATSSPDNVAYVGGIVGYNTGRIMNCKSEVTVNGKMVADAVEGGTSEASDGLFGLTGDKAAALQAEIDNAIATATKKTGSCTVGDAPIKLTGTVSNATITVAGSTKPAYIILENVTFTGTVKSSIDRDVYIISIGTKNTVKGSADTSPFNVAKANLYVTGDAPLTVTGGNRSEQSTAGATGLDGVVAVNAKAMYIDAEDVSFVGGSGGNGGNGATGKNGGSGGQGAVAISSTAKIYVYQGEIKVTAGTGGNGGRGGNGANNTTSPVHGQDAYRGGIPWGAGYYYGTDGTPGKAGGTAGNGGNGGASGELPSTTQFNIYKEATVILTYGLYGNGGDGGTGGKGSVGGDGGSCDYASNAIGGLKEDGHTHGGKGADGGAGGDGGNGGNGRVPGVAGTGGSGGAGGVHRTTIRTCTCEYSKNGSKGASGHRGTDGKTLTYTGTLAILKTATTEYEISNEKITWEAAKPKPTNGAALVSIGSAAEQALMEQLVNTVGGEYWIGLKRKGTSGSDFEIWEWTDGTAIKVTDTDGDGVVESYELDGNGNVIGEAYSNWYSGEPNNGNGTGENYVGLYTGQKWSDYKASASLGYITEKRTASSTNTLDANTLFTGGICGFNAEGGILENVYNKGNINHSEADGGETERYGISSDGSGVTAYAGGIAGYNAGAADAVKDAKNTGDVYAYAESGSPVQYADAYAYGIANRASSYYATGKVSAAARSANNLKTVVSDADDDGLETPPAEIEKSWPDGHELRLESVTKTTYFVNHKFDPTTVKVTFDGKDVSLVCDVRYNFYKAGHTNVTLIYEADGKQYTRLLPIYVQEASPVSISLNEEKSAYFKDTYLKGETFSTQGLIFTLTYDNGETVNIPFNSNTFRIDAPNMNLVGEQTLNVVYVADELSPLGCTVTVSVDAIRTERIQIAQEPHKTSYYPKETLDWNGMVIQRIMNDGSIENIDIAKEYANGKLRFDYVFKTEGEAVVTVIYDTVYTAEFVCRVLPVSGSDLPRLEVADAAGSAGHTVQMTVSVKNNPGFGGMNLSYEYDKTVMTLTDVTCCQSVFNLAHNKVTVMDAAENWTEDGQLLILTFELADDAPVGNYDVVIHVDEAYEYTASGLDVVDFHTVDGTLTVVELIYGDANSDGIVNTMDIMLLRRHLASRDPVTGVSTTQVGVGADANGDGVLNTKDLVLIRKHVAAKDPVTGESSVILGPAA